MTLHLAPDVHVAAFDDDLVFLDVRRDAYTCLVGAAVELDVACGASSLSLGPDSEAAIALAAAGYLAQAPRPAGRASPPAISELRIGAIPGAWRVGPGLGAAWDFAASYPGRSFARVVGAARRRPIARPDVVCSLDEAVRAFRRALPWWPASPQCLARSFSLLMWLRRAGHDADWVFGVRTWPFEAHCWLQVGAMVLDDPLDHVLRFEPILVV